MKLIVEFELNGLPQTVNAIGRKHWSVKMKEAQKWKKLVVLACRQAGVHDLRLSTASLELTRFSGRECDFDNLAGSFKHVVDGLVAAGLIIDDKPSVIGSPTFIWQKCPRFEGKIRVKVFAHSDSADTAE